MKKQGIVKNLTKALTFCLCCIFCVGVLCSTTLTVFGADEPSDGGGSARITDLTGYTVIVPVGWSASAGYGQFNIDIVGYSDDFGEFDGTSFYIGYWDEPPLMQLDSYIMIGGYSLVNSYSFTLTILGGIDTINIRLIDWLYDNNATFVNNNPPTVETGTFTVYDSFTEIIQTYTFEIGQTIGDWLNSEYNTVGAAVVTGQTMTQENDVSFISFGTIESNQCFTTYKALFKGINEEVYSSYVLSDGVRFVLEEADLVSYCYKQGWLDSFDTWYNSGYNSGYNTGYNEGYSEGETIGYEQGYLQGETSGYEQGYLQGKTEGQSSTIGNNLIGTGFSSITNALNQIIVYQSSTGTVVTLWVIISGAIGIALFIWVMKLFAGG